MADSKLPRGCEGEREGRLSLGDEEYSSPATVLIIQDAYLIGCEDLGKRKLKRSYRWENGNIRWLGASMLAGTLLVVD